MAVADVMGDEPNSQFPFWDFFCCNIPNEGRDIVARIQRALNSLFGISFVVTGRPLPKRAALLLKSSQFPFWDFFCCNTAVLNTIINTEE